MYNSMEERKEIHIYRTSSQGNSTKAGALLGASAVLGTAGYALSCLIHKDFLGWSEYMGHAADLLQGLNCTQYGGYFAPSHGLVDDVAHVSGVVGLVGAVGGAVSGLVNKVRGEK